MWLNLPFYVVTVTKASCRLSKQLYVPSSSDWCDYCLSFLPTTSNKQAGGPSYLKNTNQLYYIFGPFYVPVYHNVPLFQQLPIPLLPFWGNFFLGSCLCNFNSLRDGYLGGNHVTIPKDFPPRLTLLLGLSLLFCRHDGYDLISPRRVTLGFNFPEALPKSLLMMLGKPDEFCNSCKQVAVNLDGKTPIQRGLDFSMDQICFHENFFADILKSCDCFRAVSVAAVEETTSIECDVTLKLVLEDTLGKNSQN